MVALLLATILSPTELVEENLHIAGEIAVQYVCREYPYEDAYQSAVVGLIKSAMKYNQNSDVPFSAFCRPYMRWSCSDDVLNYTKRVLLKPRTFTTMTKYRRTKRKLERELEYEPTFHATCDRFGLSRTRRKNLWCAIHIDCGINQYETG